RLVGFRGCDENVAGVCQRGLTDRGQGDHHGDDLGHLAQAEPDVSREQWHMGIMRDEPRKSTHPPGACGAARKAMARYAPTWVRPRPARNTTTLPPTNRPET